MWKPFRPGSVSVEGDGDDVEDAFIAAVRQACLRIQKSQSSLGYPRLLCVVHIFLGRGLDAESAGLHFHKMYSSSIKRDDIYLQMPVSPVPFQYRVSYAMQEFTRNVFAAFA